MLTPLISIILSIITSSSAIELPVHEVPTFEDSEFSTLDFIQLSFQPLLITKALQPTTLDKLGPWTFPSLSSSLEAATTFGIASQGTLSHFDVMRGSGGEVTGEIEEMPMSLRRFGMEGADDSMWLHAFTAFTKELG